MSVQKCGEKSAIILLFMIGIMLFPPSIFCWHFPWDQNHLGCLTYPADKTNPPDPPNDRCKGTPSPCFVKSGNLVYDFDDLYIPSPGLPLIISRSYNSQDKVNGPFGYGWTFNYYMRLSYTFDGTNHFAVLSMPNGQRYKFKHLVGGSFDPPPSIWDILTKNPDNSYTLTAKGGGLSYAFSANGYLQSIQNDSGDLLDFIYDASNRLERIQNNVGKHLQISYNASGRISLITDNSGRQVGYTYDGQGNLTGVTDPENRTTVYKYESPNPQQEHFLTSISDNWGRMVFQSAYYPNHKVQSYMEKGEIYTLTYPAWEFRAGMTIKSDSAGNPWNINYSDLGLITSVQDPNGGRMNYIYDTNYQIGKIDDEEGVSTFYTYGSDGNLINIKRAYGTAEEKLWNYTYDETFPEKIRKIQAPAGYTSWEYEYCGSESNAPGKLYKIYRIRTDGETKDLLTTYAYNNYGQITSATDGLGKVTSYQYDPSSRNLASVTYPKNSDAGANPTYSFTYNGYGRVLTETNPLGRTTSYTYDNLGRVKTMTLPRPSPSFSENFVITYSYDHYEDVGGKKLVYTTQEDPNGRSTRYYYDEFDQLVRMVDATGKISQFEYEKGKLIRVLDANLNSTTYEYDKLKRLITIHHPSGATSSYAYYKDGLLKTITDGKGQTITFVYDLLKRLKEKQYPNGQKIIYAYSGENLGSVQDQVANETTNFTYDSSYRLSSISNPRGTISYAYMADDQLQTYQVNSNPSVAFAYYDDGSVKTITRPGDNPLTYYYLLTGQKSQVVYPNNASASLSYDDQGRLAGIINRKPDSSVLSSYAYGYDYNQATGSYSMKGFRTSMTNHLAQQEKYYFDNLYQLTRVDYGNGDMHQWSYDDIGNRIQQTVTPFGQSPIVTNYTYYQNSQGKNSQLLQSDGTNSYVWDNNGNLLTKGTTNYTWDYDDRLAAISGGTGSAAYAYDYRGERIKRTVGGVETGYLYQAEDIVKETSGGTVTDYLHGIGIDDPVMLDRSGAKSYYFGDGLGSIREMTDTTGTVQNNYSYGAWGELRAQSVTVPNSYGYTGREFAEEGLYYYRARYMDPGLGKFVSKDLQSNLENTGLYSYVGSNPIIYGDPSGEMKICHKVMGRPLDTDWKLREKEEYTPAHWELIRVKTLNAVIATKTPAGFNNNFSPKNQGAPLTFACECIYGYRAKTTSYISYMNVRSLNVYRCYDSECLWKEWDETKPEIEPYELSRNKVEAPSILPSNYTRSKLVSAVGGFCDFHCPRTLK